MPLFTPGCRSVRVGLRVLGGDCLDQMAVPVLVEAAFPFLFSFHASPRGKAMVASSVLFSGAVLSWSPTPSNSQNDGVCTAHDLLHPALPASFFNFLPFLSVQGAMQFLPAHVFT